MLKINSIFLGIILFFYSLLSWADNVGFLKTTRETIIKKYVEDLGKADYKDIISLFEKNGQVISTSKGKMEAKDFFYGFLSNVVTAKTSLHQYFINPNNENLAIARFNFIFKMKNGEEGKGEYIDEFIFSDHTHLLTEVAMFENLHYPSTKVKK